VSYETRATTNVVARFRHLSGDTTMARADAMTKMMGESRGRDSDKGEEVGMAKGGDMTIRGGGGKQGGRRTQTTRRKGETKRRGGEMRRTRTRTKAQTMRRRRRRR